jgi:plasmid replication initiation protein
MVTSKAAVKSPDSKYARGKAKAEKILKDIEARKESEAVANDASAVLPSIIPDALSKASSLREPPKGDEQRDIFVPTVYDVSTKDTRATMDVAIYRLSKRDKRPNTLVRTELSNGYIEIQSGPAGMASVWDYDLILMAVSSLTQAVNLHRAGKGPMPGRVFKPSVTEILKFCRRSDGGRQYEEMEAVLDRLHTTTVKVVRTIKGKGGRDKQVNDAEAFITRRRLVSDAKTGRLVSVEMEIANWIYEEITIGTPGVLTLHEDYFLIEAGLARFLYRLARLAAGKTTATWNFRTLYERSNSTGTFKEFSRMLREGVLKTNDLPEYKVSMEEGKDGPKLRMTHRDFVETHEVESANDDQDAVSEGG